jgi:hypothetical protein
MQGKDPIASFDLRAARPEQLSAALGGCFAEFSVWHGQAAFIANFSQDSRIAGVRSVVAERIHQTLTVAEEANLIVRSAKARSNHEIASKLAEHQLLTADQGVKMSAIVMLHNACERYLWRLVRFGLVANRTRAFEWIARRTVTLEALVEEGVDGSIDGHIEKWWNELERDTLMRKWDRLVGLVGPPTTLDRPPWHFDRDMLSRFDEVRHNAVHHDGQAVKAFDFAIFAEQLLRAQLAWFVHVGLLLKLKVPAESMLGPRP